MNEKLLAGLNESRRDALVPYYLKHVIPTRNLGTLAAKITTADDLYEYLLLDPKVSGQIKTSRIAEAVASAQLYLHRCREQLEPDVDATAMQEVSESNGYFSRWNTYNKRYATWAGLQRLLYYPATYLDPELRYSKTRLFQELESAINQGRITDERVEQAFTQYVSGLRSVLDIRYDSGYQVDGAIRQGVAYFCGSIPGTTGEYYWRRTEHTDYGINAKVRNPVSWSEWLKIDAPLQPRADTTPSIVYFADRLHVMCIHEYSNGAKATNVNGVTDTKVTTKQELQMATLRPDGQWKLRTWPLPNNPTRVFAAELREVNANVEPVLGVFVYMDNGINLYRFNTCLQMLDSIGNNLTLSAVHNNKIFSLYYDIVVHQPLTYQPAVPPASPWITSDYDGYIWSSNQVCHLYGVLASAPSGQLIFSIVADTSPSFSGVITFKFYKSDTLLETWGVDVVSNSSKRLQISTPYSFADFVADVSYRVVISYGSFEETVPLIRSAPGVPAKVNNYPDNAHLWIPTAFNSQGRTQMLHTKPANANEYTLTTLAGPLLEQKMLEGVDALLSWDVQQMSVDPSGYEGGTANRKISFEGGVGVYTWELFFHAPFLIANRLLAEQRFDEADRWFKRIFNSAGYRNASGVLQMSEARPRYWNVRPLQDDDTWGASSPVDTDDPDLIATADPMNYKLAIFLRGLESMAARGDQLYRQQTRDSLNEAKMWYVQALQLLGSRPLLPLAQNWPAPTLEVASTSNSVRLLELEAEVNEQQLPELLAPASQRMMAVANGPFLPPVDTAVLAYWDRFEGRLFNLRHHLSIDGQPLSLKLFEAATDPRELQLARNAGDGAGGLQGGSAAALWPQRFVVLLERARNAVQQVISFGASLQGVLERRDADALNVLQQTQQGSLLALMGESHAANLASLQHTRTGLECSLDTALARQVHFDKLFDENISKAEQRAMNLRSDAVFVNGAAGVLRITAGGLNQLPTMAMAGGGVGFFMGGAGWGKLGSAADAASDVMRLASDMMESVAAKVDVSEQYRRRRQDWDLQRDQARREGEAIKNQIEALDEQMIMAKKQRQQAELEQAYNDTVLEMLSTRFSGQALFNWQAARLSTLYYQLYDTVSGLCAQTQLSLRWETNDNRNYLRPGNWSDLYQGLLAGESQLLSLQQMEAAFLKWDKRTLQVRKTASLRTLEPALFSHIKQLLAPDDQAVVQGAGTQAVVAQLEDNNLALNFNLQNLNIQGDYPSSLNLGNSRKIKTLSVTLPALLGPYENVQALLRYNGTSLLPDGCKAVALSHGLDDSGQFQLDFNDGQYLPFEGLPVDQGAFSLVFPNATSSQQAMLLSLSDIILHIGYTIR